MNLLSLPVGDPHPNHPEWWRLKPRSPEGRSLAFSRNDGSVIEAHHLDLLPAGPVVRIIQELIDRVHERDKLMALIDTQSVAGAQIFAHRRAVAVASEALEGTPAEVCGNGCCVKTRADWEADRGGCRQGCKFTPAGHVWPMTDLRLEQLRVNGEDHRRYPGLSEAVQEIDRLRALHEEKS